MGSYIHAWIEAREDRMDGSRGFYAFASPYLGNNSIFMQLMEGGGDDLSVQVMRDLPPDITFSCERDATFIVNDELAHLELADEYCTREEAEKWVQRGKSVYRRDNLVTDPDAYWHSWMVVSELEEVQRRFRLQTGDSYLLLEAVIAAMRVLDRDPNHLSRLVFWFHS